MCYNKPMIGRRLSVFLFLLLIPFFAWSTAQRPDRLLYKGKPRALLCNPLEAFFALYPDKRPKVKATSTALWRGYIASFELKKKQLYLIDVAIEVYQDKSYQEKSVMQDIFPGKDTIKADWYSGFLIIPDGKLKKYIHMGYASLYKRYLIIKIDKGLLIDKKRLSTEEFLDFQKKGYHSLSEY